MDGEGYNSANEDKSFNHEHAWSAFCEELLCCAVCGKLYFSRHPVALLSFSRKNFYVCLDCIRSLKCSVCGRASAPENTLAVENLPESSVGYLCSRCRERVLLGIRGSRWKFFGRLRSGISRVLGLLKRHTLRVARIKIWSRSRRE